MDLERLKADAASLLAEEKVSLVIAHRRRGGETVPGFFTTAEQTADLTYDPACRLNLAAYLRKPEVRRRRPVAVVARPAVMRSLLLLASEHQLTDDDVRVLAVGDEAYHGVLTLAETQALLAERYAEMAPEEATLAEIARIDAMPPEERARFWRDQFAKCTRCYACRAACPMCYCQQCIVEKNMPQWISTAPRPHGNYAWNIIRAFHLAGRCTECGACEAACPQGIPLMLLNTVLAQEARERYGYRAGYDAEAEPLIGSWSPEDDETFIR